MKNPLILFSCMVFVCSLNIDAQNPNQKTYTPPVQKERSLGHVNLIQNIRYAPIPEIADDSISDRILDLYIPEEANPKKALPVFVFIHGGGFVGGDKGMTDLCTKIAANGFVVASINYRLTLKYKKVKEAACSANMENGLPENNTFHPVLNEAVSNASEDAVMALKWLKDNAATYNLDVDKVAISGGSAGAMTALHVAYASRQKILPIKAVVDLWGGLENVKVIKRKAPPIMIYHGDLDKLISVDYAYALAEKMKQIGSEKSVLHILKDRGHAQYKYIAEAKITEIVDFLKTNLH